MAEDLFLLELEELLKRKTLDAAIFKEKNLHSAAHVLTTQAKMLEWVIDRYKQNKRYSDKT